MDRRQASADAAELIRDRASYIERHKLFGFVPNEKQRDFIEHDTVKRKGMAGSNRLGKTAIVVIESADHAWGCRPFLPQSHPNFRVRMPNGEPIPVPNRGQMCGVDFPVAFMENIYPTWQEWIPKGTYEVNRLIHGVPREIWIDVSSFPWADKNHPDYPYSRIFIHAYVQGREAFQGIKCHWVMDDEPPPKPVYIEQARSLIDYGGKWMGAMTIADDSYNWIYDLFIPPRRRDRSTEKEFEGTIGSGFRDESFYLVEGTMFDNLRRTDGSGGLSMANIRDFEKDIEDDPVEVQVRIYGKRRHLLGTEFGRLWDENVHVLEEHREPDPDACHIVLCDAHPTKAYAILWCEWNHKDELYFWHECYDPALDDLDSIAAEIKRVERWKKNHAGSWILGSAELLPQLRLIDPIAKTHEKTIGMAAIEFFASQPTDQFPNRGGIYWQPWAKGDKISRTRMVKGLLKPGEGPIGRPRMTFSPECFDTITQMPRYREKRPKDPEIQPRTGEFVDVDADLVQCVIAVASSGLNWETLSAMKEDQTGVRRQADGTFRSRRSGQTGYYLDVEEDLDPVEREMREPWQMRKPHRPERTH